MPEAINSDKWVYSTVNHLNDCEWELTNVEI